MGLSIPPKGQRKPRNILAHERRAHMRRVPHHLLQQIRFRPRNHHHKPFQHNTLWLDRCLLRRRQKRPPHLRKLRQIRRPPNLAPLNKNKSNKSVPHPSPELQRQEIQRTPTQERILRTISLDNMRRILRNPSNPRYQNSLQTQGNLRRNHDARLRSWRRNVLPGGSRRVLRRHPQVLWRLWPNPE